MVTVLAQWVPWRFIVLFYTTLQPTESTEESNCEKRMFYYINLAFIVIYHLFCFDRQKHNIFRNVNKKDIKKHKQKNR